MDIQWRIGPNGQLETFYGDRWQPVDGAWLSAREAAGHTLIQAPVTAGSIAASSSPMAGAFGQLDQRMQAVATQQRPNPAAFSADGATLSDTGEILSLPGQTSAPSTPPTPATTNVDPGANWDYSSRRPTAPTTATSRPQRVPEDYSAASINPADVDRYMGILDRYVHGGMVRNYAEGGMTLPPDPSAPAPNAVVGEGLEADHPELDDPSEFRGEIVAVPTGKGINNYDFYHAEGPITMTLPDRTLIHPLMSKHEALFRDTLPPIDAMPQPKTPKAGQPGQTGGTSGTSAGPGPSADMMLPPEVQQFATGGQLYGREFSQFDQQPGGMFAPSLWLDPWAGMERRDFGSLRGYAQASGGERTRRNQLLVSGGTFGGADAEENYYRSYAPKPLALPIYG